MDIFCCHILHVFITYSLSRSVSLSLSHTLLFPYIFYSILHWLSYLLGIFLWLSRKKLHIKNYSYASDIESGNGWFGLVKAAYFTHFLHFHYISAIQEQLWKPQGSSFLDLGCQLKETFLWLDSTLYKRYLIGVKTKNG